MKLRHLFFAVGVFLISGTALAATHNVTVSPNGDYTFSPSTLTINKGDSVTWTYSGGAMPHNVVANDGSFRCAKGCDGTGGNGNATAAAFTFTLTFNNAGSVPYFCEVHAGFGMTGTITVNDTAPPPPPPQGHNIDASFSGNWFNPSANQGGHGFQIEIQANNAILVIWFVFSPDGTSQNWIYMQGTYDPTKNSVTIPAVLEQGGRFPPNFDQSKLSAPAWGALTLTFNDCNSGTAEWKSNAASAAAGYGDIPAFPIARLTTILGTSCH
jgi:plastocyanin